MKATKQEGHLVNHITNPLPLVVACVNLLQIRIITNLQKDPPGIATFSVLPEIQVFKNHLRADLQVVLVFKDPPEVLIPKGHQEAVRSIWHSSH